MKYRMKSFGADMPDWGAPVTGADVMRLAAALSTDEIRDSAARLEHDRWNAFMRTRGLRTAGLTAP